MATAQSWLPAQTLDAANVKTPQAKRNYQTNILATSAGAEPKQDSFARCCRCGNSTQAHSHQKAIETLL